MHCTIAAVYCVCEMVAFHETSTPSLDMCSIDLIVNKCVITS